MSEYGNKMSEYVGLIVTEKYEFQINFSCEQRFWDFIEDSPAAIWGKLFDRKTGNLITSYSKE